MGKRPLFPRGIVRTSMSSPQSQSSQLTLLAASRVNQGMITTIDPADIPEESLVLALNSRSRFDKTLWRSGTINFGTTPPDSNAILAIYNVREFSGFNRVLRFTKNSISEDPAGWTDIPGNPAPLTGSDSDRFNIVTAFNQVAFTNNGHDLPQIIDFTVPEYKPLGNAIRHKYMTAFANRIVLANCTESGSEDPIRLSWSADGFIDEYDPLVDESAGFGDLVESPGDLSDFITGVFGFTNVCVVLRQRSIWIGVKQPSATEPFNFQCAVPGKGCGCPSSATIIPGGLVFADNRTQEVYFYQAGQEPLKIATQIKKDIFSAVSDPALVFGSYDARNDEYSLAIPLVGTMTVKVWIYNFQTQSWVVDERNSLTSINDLEGISQGLSWNDLVGTWDDLVGSWDDLTGNVDTTTSRLYGFSDGTLQLEDESAADDTGVVFTRRWISKTFELPVTDMYVARLRYKIFASQASTFRLYYSFDGGINWTFAREDTVTILDAPYIIEQVKQVKCTQFTFKIEGNDGAASIIGYELHTFRSGITRGSSISTV